MRLPGLNVVIIVLLASAFQSTAAEFHDTNKSAPATSFVIFPALAVTNESGISVPLLSPEAYRAEFRYLQRVCHSIDLSGSARRMTGLQKDVPETQWPFMQFCYFGFACVNLAACDPLSRDEALGEARWLIEALQTPRLTGFIADHFGPPFGEMFHTPSVFVHGFFLNLAVRYREVARDRRFDPLIHRIASTLSHEFAKSEQGILPTYPNMWWITDNLPALSALSRYDRLFRTNLSVVKERFLHEARAHYLDQKGLRSSYIDPVAHDTLQGARGVGTSYALHFLRDVDAQWATAQYALTKREFFRSVLGFAAVREFPEGTREEIDVDSGAILFGFGTAASGFGIAAAAVMSDESMTTQLLKSSALIGSPVLQRDELRYDVMPPVGQAVILFGKTELLTTQMNREKQVGIRLPPFDPPP
jgi:hypothetical protein